MWYVYILICDDDVFYVGMTNNVLRRFNEHKNKLSFFTKKFSNVELVYCEKYSSQTEALKRERQLKGWNRKKKQTLIKGQFDKNRIDLS